MSFRDKLRSLAQDVATLDVITLTGEIKLELKGSGDALDLEKLHRSLAADASGGGKVEVLAFTHLELDKDATCFVRKGLNEEQLSLLEAHGEMVSAAANARATMVRTFAAVLGLDDRVDDTPAGG